jgi:hypothetical protein
MLLLIADLAVANKIPTDGHVTVQDPAASCAVLPEPSLRVLRALGNAIVLLAAHAYDVHKRLG